MQIVYSDRIFDEPDTQKIFQFINEYAYKMPEDFFELYYALKSLFGRDVDLVDASAVKNPYFKQEIDEKKYLIYG